MKYFAEIFRQALRLGMWLWLYNHSSEKKRFLVNLKTEKIALKFAMFMEKKTHVVFFVFHLEQLLFSPYECPGLCRLL